MKRTFGNILYSAWDVFWIVTGKGVSTWMSKVSLILQGCSFGNGFSTTGKCSFKARNSDSIVLGQKVTLLAGWRSNRVGLAGKVLLQTFGSGRILIGDGAGASSVIISARSVIAIGKNVCLGGNVRILDHDFHALDTEERKLTMMEQESKIRSAPIRIGDDVFVGTNAIILKGVSIGDRSIVAAGAVVFRGDYPADSIIAGNPAVVVRIKNCKA